MPDGKAFSEDAKGNVELGSYLVINPSNMVIVAEDGTNTVPFYFPSENEVIVGLPSGTILLKRINPN
jgi:hypothetical protein